MASTSPPTTARNPIFRTNRILPKTSFIDLPFEVREKVYRHALTMDLWCAPLVSKAGAGDTIGVDSLKKRGCYICTHRTFAFPNARLLQTCRLIEYEASPFLYGNTFGFGGPCCRGCRDRRTTTTNLGALIPFLSQIGEKNVRLITHLVLGLGWNTDDGERSTGPNRSSRPNGPAAVAEGIRLFAQSGNLRRLHICTINDLGAEWLFREPESGVVRSLASLRGIEEFMVWPWPGSLNEFEGFHNRVLLERSFSSLEMHLRHEVNHRAAFRRFLELKATIMQPKQRVQAALSRPEERSHEAFDESKVSDLPVAKLVR